jgi:single-strand DNA-binding protein
MINRVVISGRLGSDPRITDFDGGGKSAQFSMAVTERGYKRQDGTEVPEKVDWIRVETSRSGIAGVIEKYVKRGSFVMIDGKLRTREWEKDGVKQTATVVVIENLELCPRNGEQNNASAPPPSAEARPTTNNSRSTSSPPPVYTQDDDLPF